MSRDDCGGSTWTAGTPGAATVTSHPCRESALIIVYATLGQPIGEPYSYAMARRESVEHDDIAPGLTSRLWRPRVATSAVQGTRWESHRAGRQALEPFPKTAIYCHLLPFCAAKSLRLLQSYISLLAPRGRAGQPGPRAENRERGRQEPRCQAVTECQFVP
jgi:hypothetical protein